MIMGSCAGPFPGVMSWLWLLVEDLGWVKYKLTGKLFKVRL